MSLRVEVDAEGLQHDVDLDVLTCILVLAARDEPLLPDGNWTLGVRLIGDAEIVELHDRFFGDPSPTDVITFPADDPDAGGGHLGDIVISVETAGRHAREFGQSTAREVAFLGIHGLLHICGYNDGSAAERDAMLARQEELLSGSEATLGRRL